ncbi:DsbA family protein, partial [Patescibacteria group bacterium]
MENSSNNVPNTKKHWYKKWWGILLIIFLLWFLSFLAAFGFYIFDVSRQIKGGLLPISQLTTNPEDSETQKLIEGSEDNYWLGSPDPKLTIVEFGDFACPFCQKSFPTIRELSVKHKDKIKIIFRDFPVTHEHSLVLSLAARCAGEQGLFWVMHDKLFLNQGVSREDELVELAKQVGADTKRFQTCFDQ